MRRRHFLAGLAALAACDRETVQSVIVEPVPGDGLAPLPESQIDGEALNDRLTLSLGGTLFEELGDIGERVDLELRAMAAIAPESALLGVATIENLVLPGLDVVTQLRERPDMDEEEMGALVASVFDLSARRDTLLPMMDRAEAELAQVGTVTPESQEMVASVVEDLAGVLRGQLAVADREDNAFARQLVHQLDLLAHDVRSNIAGLMDQSRTALETAPEMPAGPPFANLCTNLNYSAENIDRHRLAIAQYLSVVGSTALLTGLAVRTVVTIGLRVPFGGMIALLAGMGLVALMMPFLLYSVPTVYKPLHYRMCDCEGNN